MLVRIMLSSGVLSTKLFVLYYVVFFFFRQTFGHDLLLEEQSGTKNTFKEGQS